VRPGTWCRGQLRIRDYRLVWRLGWMSQNWVIGVRYDPAPDVWIWSLGSLALIVGRA